MRCHMPDNFLAHYTLSSLFHVTVALCATCSGIFSITWLSLLVRPRLCRCTVLGALPQFSGQSAGLIPASVLPRAHLLRTFKPLLVSAQRLLTILSMSCTCGNSTVFFRVLKLVLIAVVGNMDQIVCFFVVVTSRRCVLSWPLTSCTVECEILFSTLSLPNC